MAESCCGFMSVDVGHQNCGTFGRQGYGKSRADATGLLQSFVIMGGFFFSSFDLVGDWWVRNVGSEVSRLRVSSVDGSVVRWKKEDKVRVGVFLERQSLLFLKNPHSDGLLKRSSIGQ
ncbi:hypothetical protein KC19_2G017200 [Ceratodon purpureus]|uniref:Uncharacterized protein n=1 Tax=Ceratodon purpureus TaxID=3225 RepID=A0A8T0IP23_CERPU|nr:hypothetical protein KC19_2G017200 [Ceratodon purpureus]